VDEPGGSPGPCTPPPLTACLSIAARPPRRSGRASWTRPSARATRWRRPRRRTWWCCTTVCRWGAGAGGGRGGRALWGRRPRLRAVHEPPRPAADPSIHHTALRPTPSSPTPPPPTPNPNLSWSPPPPIPSPLPPPDPSPPARPQVHPQLLLRLRHAQGRALVLNGDGRRGDLHRRADHPARLQPGAALQRPLPQAPLPSAALWRSLAAPAPDRHASPLFSPVLPRWSSWASRWSWTPTASGACCPAPSRRTTSSPTRSGWRRPGVGVDGALG
jgi:hypothetical protein